MVASGTFENFNSALLHGKFKALPRNAKSLLH
jgi:hypothetical protein